MSTVEHTSHRIAPNRPRSQGRLARRLTGPGWVIMTLACVYIAMFWASRYLTFDPEVYFTQQREAYLEHEFALGVHVLSGMLALLIGPFQFVGRLRRRFVRVHRFMGATYVASASALGMSGLILAPDGLYRPGGIRWLHRLGLGHAVDDLDRGADDLGRPVRRAPALDDPELLPDHGRCHVASVVTAIQRRRRGWDRRFLVRDCVRRNCLAVLGAEPAARDLVHPPPSRCRECGVSRHVPH
jgi:Predicted membrane protein (DUF2306)